MPAYVYPAAVHRLVQTFGAMFDVAPAKYPSVREAASR
jgi:hypothetical protein